VLRGLAQAALALTGSASCFLAELPVAGRSNVSGPGEENGNRVSVVVSANGGVLPPAASEVLAEKVIERGACIILGAETGDSEPVDSDPDLTSSGIRDFLGIPLRFGDQLLGVLGMVNRPMGYSADDMAVLEPFISTCTGLIHAIQVRTREKQFTEKLRQSEERFRTLVEHAPYGIFVRVNGDFAYLNQTATNLLGGTADQIVGTSVLDRFHPDCREAIAERIRLIDQEGRAVPPVQEDFLRLDGTTLRAEVSAVPFAFEGGQGALVFFQDTTERNRLEAQFRQSQKMEALGQLTGGVAHDFNNILAATLMHLALLQENRSFDQEAREILNDLEKQTSRAADLTRQLLLFSRRSTMRLKLLNLNLVLAELHRMLKRLLGEQIDIELRTAPTLPEIMGDPGMIEQVVVNLCVNARDAMPGGGRLILKTSVTQISVSKASRNSEARPGKFVCLSVADSGCGMSPAVMERVFDPFFTTKEAGKGTGLGLSTVYGIVKQHRGWIEVESEEGKGSEFTVFFPVNQNASKDRGDIQSEPVQGGKETILLVEDESGLRRTMAIFLRRLGYRIIEAGDGPEALSIWEEERDHIALLLTDMVMPKGITGLDLCTRLQKDKPGLKVIISSGYSEELSHHQNPSERSFIYLSKPCPSERLAATVRECLDSAP